MRNTFSSPTIGLMLAAIGACAPGPDSSGGETEGETTAPASAATRDSASRGMRQTAGYDIVSSDDRTIGRAELEDGESGLLLVITVEGLSPGLHGLHLHETGRCEPPDFTSAGGHWAPRGHAHGFLADGGPHAGDLPNLSVPEGAARVEQHVFADGLSIARLRDDDGSALIIHAGADDYRSQPSGAAGARVACAAITGG